ncbi:MAG: hypothetical protein BWY67_02148 [Bacteroidetes bacterium ADurb.Bin397]|nr:MAG: hypothetical protein BWY67_02148 [Bacteroidetes bacterium ADurb.Bin397]
MRSQVIFIPADGWKNFIFKNAGRDIPVRTENDVFHFTIKDDGFVLVLSNHNVHTEYQAVFFKHMQPEIGNINQQVVCFQFLWYPAAPFHVNDDLFNSFFNRNIHFADKRCRYDASFIVAETFLICFYRLY